MADLNMEAERAAPELLDCPFCGCEPDFLLDEDNCPYVTCHSCDFSMPAYRPGFEHMAIAAWNRRAAPIVGDDGLPPLPAPDVHAGTDPLLSPGTAYSAAKVRQAQRDAIAADRAARAQQKAQTGGRGWIGSVGDYAQFHVLLNTVCNASEELEKAEGREVFAAADNLEKAKDALIAYIDGHTAGAAPEGWKLVPIEPTMDMAKAGAKHTAIVEGEETEATTFHEAIGRALYAWQDMLAAAPSPQQGKEGA